MLVPLAGRVLLFTFPVTVNCQRDNSRFAFVVQRNKCVYICVCVCVCKYCSYLAWLHLLLQLPPQLLRQLLPPPLLLAVPVNVNTILVFFRFFLACLPSLRSARSLLFWFWFRFIFELTFKVFRLFSSTFSTRFLFVLAAF